MKRFAFSFLFAVCLLALPSLARAEECNKSGIVSVAAAATGQIITGDSSKSTYICGFLLTGNTTATGIQLFYGTGTLCFTGSTNLTPIMLTVANGNLSYGGGQGMILTAIPTGANLCLGATTGAVTGFITYKQ